MKNSTFFILMSASLLLISVAGCEEEDSPTPPLVEMPTVNEIPDYSFIQRQFFFLENPGPSFLTPKPGFLEIYPLVNEYDSVEVFMEIDETDFNEVAEYIHWNFKAWPVPENGILNPDYNKIYRAKFRLLKRYRDFDLIRDYSYQGIEPRYKGICLYEPLPDPKALAVRYVNNQADTIGDYGNFADSDTLLAELICPRFEDFFPPDGPQADYPSTWYMMLRNVYAFDSEEIVNHPPEIYIENTDGERIEDNTLIHFIRVFGLDNYDKEGNPLPDGLVDNKEGMMNYSRGWLMFPWPEPFDIPKEVMENYLGDSIASVLDTALVRNEEIYDDRLVDQPSHYTIVVKKY